MKSFLIWFPVGLGITPSALFAWTYFEAHPRDFRYFYEFAWCYLLLWAMSKRMEPA